MQILRATAALTPLVVICGTVAVSAQAPLAVVGVTSGPSAEARGALIRCVWPDGPTAHRLLLEGETACGRYTLVAVDGTSARLRDDLSGVLLEMEPGTVGAAAVTGVSPVTLRAGASTGPERAHTADVVRVALGRAEFDAYLRNPAALLAGADVQAAVVSAHSGPRVEGFELRTLPSSGLLNELGLRAGDVLLELNGARVTGPATVAAALEGLRAAGHATALVRRGDARVTVVVDLR